VEGIDHQQVAEAEEQEVTEDQTIRSKLRLLKKHTDDLKKLTPTDTQLADTIGLTRSLEVALAEFRHRLERLTAEMEPVADPRPTSERANPNERAGTPVAQGKQFDIVPKWKNVYTYNTPAILVGAAKVRDLGPTDVLMEMIDFQAVRLTWQLTKLRNYAEEWAIPMRVGREDVSDHAGLDAPMMGKRRVQDGVTRVPVKT